MIRSQKFDVPEREEKILKFWEKQKIFEKSLEKNKEGKVFVFYEGPPTANGRPGIHHVEARSFKDIVLRYKSMRGFYVPRKAGWDTHGLPVELEVEKKLGVKTKQDIENYGIAKFNAAAKQSVWQYKEEWERLTKRMGFWIDLGRPYITYETSYIETLWRIIKEFWDKGLLYEDFKVVPWCPRCQTGLSSHEVGQGYKEVEDTAVYVKFKLKAQSPKFKATAQNPKLRGLLSDIKIPLYILSWTTTPWTLPGNVALAVGKDIEYVLAEAGDERLIIAAPRLESVIGKEARVIERFSAKDLVGLEYEPLFDVPELLSDKSHRVYVAPFVSAAEGTGIVHTAVMYGEDDYRLGSEIGLPKFHTVTEDGKFIAELKDLGGMAVKDRETEEKILKVLEEKNLLFKKEKYRHEYPHCWRCETPLLYYARKAWWVKTTAVKKELIANNEQVNWIPAHIKRGRFGEFLRDLRDWAFSRERYWGTPLPIWRCGECGDIGAIGSLAELKKRAVGLPRDENGEVNLHRPYVDDIVLKCDKCGGLMRRTPEVADVWFDSGAMPFAQAHWPSAQTQNPHPPPKFLVGGKKPKTQKFGALAYPADYICEAVDQTRGWFYTLLAVGTLLGRGPAYRNVISLGHVLDKNGEKMSKSKGNVVDPWEMMEKYGADALRWYFYTVNAPGDPKLFDEQDAALRGRGFVATLWNSFVFFDTYIDRIPSFKLQAPSSKHILDRWLDAQLNNLIYEMTKRLDAYDIVGAARLLDEFVINEFSQWYVRHSRRRLQHPETDAEKREAAMALGAALAALARLAAPFAPFLAEMLWQGLRKKMKLKEESVHLAGWPIIKTQNPHPPPKFLVGGKKPKTRIIEDMKMARAMVAEGLRLRAEAGIKIRQPLLLFQVPRSEFQVQNKREFQELIKQAVNVKKISAGKDFSLDTAITPELRKEGIIRELIRAVQEMRRGLGLAPKNKIRCWITGEDESLAAVSRHREFIVKEIGAREFNIGKSTKQSGLMRKVQLDGGEARVYISK